MVSQPRLSRTGWSGYGTPCPGRGAGRHRHCAIARRLAGDGYDLVVADLCAAERPAWRSRQPGRAGNRASIAEHGGKALPLRVDVADGASVQAMIAATRGPSAGWTCWSIMPAPLSGPGHRHAGEARRRTLGSTPALSRLQIRAACSCRRQPASRRGRIVNAPSRPRCAQADDRGLRRQQLPSSLTHLAQEALRRASPSMPCCPATWTRA